MIQPVSYNSQHRPFADSHLRQELLILRIYGQPVDRGVKQSEEGSALWHLFKVSLVQADLSAVVVELVVRGDKLEDSKRKNTLDSYLELKLKTRKL